MYVKARPSQAPGALPDVSAFDLTAARAVIEAEAAAMAASRITDAELQDLAGLIAAMVDPASGEAAASEADRQFHLSIARIAGNPVVEHCVQLIWRMRNELPRVKQVYANVCHNDDDTRDEEHTAMITLAVDPPRKANVLADIFGIKLGAGVRTIGVHGRGL